MKGLIGSACPACGSPEVDSEVAVPDHEYAVGHVGRYSACRACASLYQRPVPSSEELASFYPADYHSMVGGGPIDRVRDDIRLRRLARLAGPDGPVLDYGCGDGDFLLRVAARWPSRDCWGFEIGPQAETRDLADTVTVVRGEHADLMAVLPPCRLVTMNHVIEHLSDPYAVLVDLRDKLVPGGALEGQTPAAGSLEHRVFGTSWSGYHSPRHTVVFTPEGLETLLERAGFVDVEVKRAFNPAAVAVSLAAVGQRGSEGRIRRTGAVWLGLVGVATLCAPVDLLSKAPGVVNFSARRPYG